jgi:hypothetical protein
MSGFCTSIKHLGGRHCCDQVVDGFISADAISPYHSWSCAFDSIVTIVLFLETSCFFYYLFQVSGFSAPKPVCSFAHFGLDDTLMSVIRKLEYTQPTPIQAQVI